MAETQEDRLVRLAFERREVLMICPWRLGAAAACLCMLAACGSDAVTSESTSDAPYDGPMVLPQDFADEATALERSGAAGAALECEGVPYDGGSGNNDPDPDAIDDSAESAVNQWLAGRASYSLLPSDGFALERDDEDRKLFSWDLEGHTLVAIIAADGMGGQGETGWGVEAWAQCDPAEFPARFDDDLDLTIWTDRDGGRAALAEITSYDDWCELKGVTMVQRGQGRPDPRYFRDPRGTLADSLRAPFQAEATLPDTATDTGFSHDGRRLWLSADQTLAYLVSDADPGDVELWPSTKEQMSCAG